MSDPSELPLSRSQLARLNYVEFRLLFAGEAARGDLIRRFGVSEAAATKDFAAYRKLFPEALEFDRSRKVYLPKDGFVPQLIGDCPEKTLLRAFVHGMGDDFMAGEDSLVSCELPVRLHGTKLDILAAVSRAIYSERAIRVEYLSASRSGTEREIVPFSFAGNGLRWHVRAFDRRAGKFKDFVVNRILSVEQLEGDPPREQRKESDEHWSRMVRLEIVPHPNCAHPRMIEVEYGMENGVLHRKMRSALVGYVLRLWNVDCTADASLEGGQFHLWLRNSETLYDCDTATLAPGYAVNVPGDAEADS